MKTFDHRAVPALGRGHSENEVLRLLRDLGVAATHGASDCEISLLLRAAQLGTWFNTSAPDESVTKGAVLPAARRAQGI